MDRDYGDIKAIQWIRLGKAVDRMVIYYMDNENGLVIKIKYTYKGFPLTRIYEVLNISGECKFISKITVNSVYVIPLDDETMKNIVVNIPNDIILGYILVTDLVNKVLENISKCRYILIRSRTPAMNGLKDLEKIISIYNDYVVSFSVKKTELGDYVELKLDMKKIDRELLERIAYVTVYGIGEKRELGFGSIDTICIDK